MSNGSSSSSSSSGGGCGVEKDPDIEEMYTGTDLCNDEPIPSLIVLDCQDYTMNGEWKCVMVCFSCFDRLSPDMWISRNCWESLNPFLTFDQLPSLGCAKLVDSEPCDIELIRKIEQKDKGNG